MAEETLEERYVQLIQESKVIEKRLQKFIKVCQKQIQNIVDERQLLYEKRHTWKLTDSKMKVCHFCPLCGSPITILDKESRFGSDYICKNCETKFKVTIRRWKKNQ